MIYHRIALNSPLPPLTYRHDMDLPIGTRVVVTLRGKTQVGFVWENNVQPEIEPERIVSITRVFADEPMLSEKWRDLIRFTAQYYHYPLGQTLFTALPAALKTAQPLRLPTVETRYKLNDLGRAQTPPSPQRAPKLVELWQALLSGSLNLTQLKLLHPQAAKYLAKYKEKKWIDENPVIESAQFTSLHTLNEAQQAAADVLIASLGDYAPFLLHGVTGSGKTEVYFHVMAYALAQGKQVLLMLPEINLTPQLLQRIAQRFSHVPIAVLHSQMASGERSRNYLRAALGQAKLIIGTRLSVFTPMHDLGLIVVDEEHDASFKQDSELRYHARDLAIWRAYQVRCPIVLGSATPSLESYYKTQTGAFGLLRLPHRAHEKAMLPEIHLLDVRRVSLENGIAPNVVALLRQNWENGGMSLVYINRRGFAPALFCGDCGHTFGCPHCSAKMVLHQRARQLRCHHCGFRQPVARTCPECGNQDLTALGHGTQRVEETLKQLLPHTRIVRVDRDSTNRRTDWEALQQRIASGEVDVLVGTQMLAKGHDFARLNLVVVLNADGSLFSSDFREPERLFAELMQVAGRAGRADRVGQVWIQTNLPEHEVFAAVKAQDYDVFAQHELQQRQMFGLPPFGFQAAVRADAPKMADALTFLNEIRDGVARVLPENVFQMGAVPMTLARLAARERAQIFVESHERRALHQALSVWQQRLSCYRGHVIRWHIDVDTQEI